MTFGTYPESQSRSTLYLMNYHWTVPTSVARATFLDGRAECQKCGAHVRPSMETSAFVRISSASTGTAWCSVCCTRTEYDLEPRRAAPVLAVRQGMSPLALKSRS